MGMRVSIACCIPRVSASNLGVHHLGWRLCPLPSRLEDSVQSCCDGSSGRKIHPRKNLVRPIYYVTVQVTNDPSRAIRFRRHYRVSVALSVLAESRAVRSCFSHANGRPSMARLIVFSSTKENTCRYVNRWIQMWNSSQPSPLLLA